MGIFGSSNWNPLGSSGDPMSERLMKRRAGRQARKGIAQVQAKQREEEQRGETYMSKHSSSVHSTNNTTVDWGGVIVAILWLLGVVFISIIIS